jgi:hypothetical protein
MSLSLAAFTMHTEPYKHTNSLSENFKVNQEQKVEQENWGYGTTVIHCDV